MESESVREVCASSDIMTKVDAHTFKNVGETTWKRSRNKSEARGKRDGNNDEPSLFNETERPALPFKRSKGKRQNPQMEPDPRPLWDDLNSPYPPLTESEKKIGKKNQNPSPKENRNG